jgi:hypothetical protein
VKATIEIKEQSQMKLSSIIPAFASFYQPSMNAQILVLPLKSP